MRRQTLSVVLGVVLLLLAVMLAAHGARPVGAAALPGPGAPGVAASVLVYLMVGVVVGAGSGMIAVAGIVGKARRRKA
jgi:hypothetical protein